MTRPMQYAVYKGLSGKWGALQLNIQPPHHYCSKCKVRVYDGTPSTCNCQDMQMIAREGAVFLEISSTKDKNVYDWENKTVMALSIDDLGKILTAFQTLQAGQKLELMHDPGAGKDHAGKIRKTLVIDTPKGMENGCMLSVYENNIDKEASKKHTVPLQTSEVTVLATLFRTAIPRLLNWS